MLTATFTEKFKGPKLSNVIQVEDANGDLVDLLYFCSDLCAKQNADYAGWDGCHELYTAETCETCGTLLTFINGDLYTELTTQKKEAK